MNLDKSVKSMGGIYKKYAGRLEKLGIIKLEDFLYHIPFRYEDYSLISKINKVQAGETVTIQGKISEIKNEYTRRWKNLQKARVRDKSGTIDIIWFNQPFIPKILKKNDRVSLSGRVKQYLGKNILESPEYETLNEQTIHTGRLIPIYSETRGISSKWIRKQIHNLIREHRDEFKEYLPDEILSINNFLNFKNAIEQIHFPSSKKNAELARERLSFDELFLLQLKSMIKKAQWKKKKASNVFEVSKFREEIGEFLEKLPFKLTNSQKKAVEDILKDLKSKKPMNRLLEGDVGSGKTVVSAITMYLSFLNGFQSVLMAPTEILAQQHYKTISDLLNPFGVKVGLVTGSKKWKMLAPRSLDEAGENARPAKLGRSGGKWKIDILVGTHAVIYGKLNFENLGLVVIDEQQRFGVKQRSQLRNRGKNPHLLTMTATPIPRTVALVIYGELDVSFLSEMPHGRKTVKTWLVPEEKRENAYVWIEKEIKNTNSQAFIICPFIEESETMVSVKAATKEFERLKKNVFPRLKLKLLHGKQKSEGKEEILNDFKKGTVDILVATPVVEVGIDIPNATIMLVEASERFGLSQLHQLRGRVGRSDKQSYCLLFTDSKNEKTLKRLKSMESINVGAQLAELDLKLRGPGEIYGTSQHGIQALKIASFSDFSGIEKSRKEAEAILPKFKKYPMLLNKIKSENLAEISPD